MVLWQCSREACGHKSNPIVAPVAGTPALLPPLASEPLPSQRSAQFSKTFSRKQKTTPRSTAQHRKTSNAPPSPHGHVLWSPNQARNTRPRRPTCRHRARSHVWSAQASRDCRRPHFTAAIVDAAHDMPLLSMASQLRVLRRARPQRATRLWHVHGPPKPHLRSTNRRSPKLRQARGRRRKHDFGDYEKHVARRKELTAKLSRPYFRDWGNLQFHEGKSFIAPPRLFKAELSLFFPNLRGDTLVKTDKEPRDTTPLLTGKASVVSIFSSQWAEKQVATFVSAESNPALTAVLAENGDAAQMVSINYEDNKGKALLVKLFRASLRKRFDEKDWEKYFIVQRGITDDIRESIGLLNSKVGYIYLVDHHCRIRWAGSGPSQPEENASLAKGLARLVKEIDTDAARPASAREQLPGKRTVDIPSL